MVSDPRPEHPLPHRRPPLNRHQLLTQVVVAVVILTSGIGIGTGGTILALKSRIIPRVRWMPTDPPGPEPNYIVARWKTDYGLSDKQAQQVKDLLTKQFTELRDIRQKLFLAEQAARDKLAASMKKPLSPEQYAKWDEAMKKRTEEFERWRSSRGPRGDHKGPPRSERGPGGPMDPNGWRGGWQRERFMDPNGHRIEGPTRPGMMEGGSRRGYWPPRPPMDPNGRRGSWPSRGPMSPPDHPKDQPPDLSVPSSNPPADTNTPK